MYTIDAPYMYDAAREASDEIKLTIEETKKGFTLTLTPDADWLADEDRVWPVVIDPTLLTGQNATNIWDVDIHNTQTSASNNVATDLLVGSKSNGTVYRSLLRFQTLPEIGDGDAILKAQLCVTAYQGPLSIDVETGNTPSSLLTRPTGSLYVNVHKMKVNWPQQGVTWAGYASSYDPLVEDYFTYNSTADAFYADVTDAVSDWYKNGSNYGFMLKASDESAGNKLMQFTSSDYATVGHAGETWRPVLAVYYRNCEGLEDYWSYSVQDLGSGGSAYVNNYNGNLTLVHADASYNSGINGFTLSHVYNTSTTKEGEGRYGNGWSLNLLQRLESVTIEDDASVKYVYTDGDGTKHYFIETDGKVVDEDGLGYTITEIDEGNLTRQITTKDDVILKHQLLTHRERG